MNNKRYGDQIEDQKRRRALAQESADEGQQRNRLEVVLKTIRRLLQRDGCSSHATHRRWVNNKSVWTESKKYCRRSFEFSFF